MRIFVGLLILQLLLAQGESFAKPVRIGPEAIVPENPRSHYSRYVNWRPADGETVHINPPRISWPYWPDWPSDFRDASHKFSLQISPNPDCSNPVVNVTCPYNFYNTIPDLVKDSTQEQVCWYWRVGYYVGTDQVEWSKIRSFIISKEAAVWDRSKLANPDLILMGHPRILFNADNINRIRQLAERNAGSKAALDFMCRQADQIMPLRQAPSVPGSQHARHDRRRAELDQAPRGVRDPTVLEFIVIEVRIVGRADDCDGVANARSRCR